MKKFRLSNIKRSIANKLDFPTDIVMDIPKIDISILGNEEISIENHKEILTFNENLIEVSTTSGIIRVKGIKLEILFIGKSTIIIGGKFKAIMYGDDSDEN
ncbi:sporulation protein YqfC [Clostridium neuense]|uniref:Sporulation protein YqfC n=1 Tax=Clostridium neuense TaxID=1728934 RepID=A0ABW8TI92_9CLOT